MELIGRAQGKLLLFGEHAVVYGHPALGLTLPLSTQVRLKAQEGDVPENDTDALMTRLASLMSPAVQEFWQGQGWQVEITSEVPMACGLGSSAALCGALARALAAGVSPCPDEREVRAWAHRAEHHFHGHPSGVDTALSLAQGLNVFDPKEQALQSCASEPLGLVLGAVERQSDTRTWVQQVHASYHDPQGQSRPRIDQLGDLTSDVIAGLAEGQSVFWLGERMTRAHRILHDLGLSTPLLDHILDIGGQAGACGGKLSGAGGGGAFVLVCEDIEGTEHVRQRLQQEFEPDLLLLRSYLWDGQGLR